MNAACTFWALVPPLIAIVVSLITKEVNLSLFLGIIIGAGLYTNFHIFGMVETSFAIIGDKVHGNIGVLIFIILLGMIVYLMNLSGATKKYAVWASRHIKTRRSSILFSALLGSIIFIDDYFNCLTVGTIMGPIFDRNKISREKLAYVIDCTAAPVCIIAPVSSWAAAVASYLPEDSGIDGFQLFMQTIPYNFYSILTLLLIVLTALTAIDFGKMRKYEMEAKLKEYEESINQDDSNAKGQIPDLLLPIIALIVFSIIAMLYTGGLFDGGVSISAAFANCDAIIALAMGAFYTVIFMAVLYLPRGIVSCKTFLDGLIQGFIHMVPASLILIFAWTLGGICGSGYLDAGGFVSAFVENHNVSMSMIPALFFVISIIISFSTGTSWGTFAIMLPIAVSVVGKSDGSLLAMATAAVLGGSVCGDHISPISDTTILSSTGAGCDHIKHVESQLPYGIAVALITILIYLISGFTMISPLFAVIIGACLELLLLLIIYFTFPKEKA